MSLTENIATSYYCGHVNPFDLKVIRLTSIGKLWRKMKVKPFLNLPSCAPLFQLCHQFPLKPL